MSFEELLEQTAAELEAEQKNAWRKNPKFLAIKGISKEDLINGSDYIEKLDRPPWLKDHANKKTKDGDLIGYGKFADLTYQEVKEKHSSYFSWMVQNVDKFRLKVKQLGLI